MDTVGSLHFFVCGHLGIYSFLLTGLSLSFKLLKLVASELNTYEVLLGLIFFLFS